MFPPLAIRRLKQCVFVRVSCVIKRHHDHWNSYKRKYLTGAHLHNFRGFIHCHHDRTCLHAGRPGLEKEMTFLYLDLQTAPKDWDRIGLAWASKTLYPALTDTLLPTTPYLLQQATTSKSTSPYESLKPFSFKLPQNWTQEISQEPCAKKKEKAEVWGQPEEELVSWKEIPQTFFNNFQTTL